MKHPGFSIIVPIYGVEKYIHRCATSLFRQNYDRIQYIFVNDGTKDRSMEILQSLIDTEFRHLKPNIVIVNKENAGLPAARKTGLEYASGDYILHVDSDDYIETDTLSKIADASERTDADMIYFNVIKEHPRRNSYKRELDYDSTTKDRFLVNILMGISLGYLVIKCFKRSVYESHTIHYATHGIYEDIFCSAQLITYSQTVCHLDEYLYHYDCSNTSSILHTMMEKRHLEAVDNLYSLYRQFLKETKNNNEDSLRFHLFFRIGYHLMKAHHPNVDDYPEIRDYILSAKIRLQDKGIMGVGRQIRIKAYFCRQIIKEKLSAACMRIRKIFY